MASLVAKWCPARGVALCALLVLSCVDPVHDDAVAALGPEVNGVRHGPLHRPGQPCLTCHGGDGPGSPDISLGGTVFATRGGAVPVVGAEVQITDATGTVRTLTTNPAGTFYFAQAEWQPTFPLRVEIRAEGITAKMTSRIGRDGSCAKCHVGTGTSSQMPGVYLREP